MPRRPSKLDKGCPARTPSKQTVNTRSHGKLPPVGELTPNLSPTPNPPTPNLSLTQNVSPKGGKQVKTPEGYSEVMLKLRGDYFEILNENPRDGAFSTSKEKNIGVATMWNEHVGLDTEQARKVAKAHKVSDVTELADVIKGLSKPVKTYKGLESWISSLEKTWKKEQRNRGLCANDTGSGSTAGTYMSNELYALCDPLFSVLEHKAPPLKNLLSLGGQGSVSAKLVKASKKRTRGKKKEGTKNKKQEQKKKRVATQRPGVVHLRRTLAETSYPSMFRQMIELHQRKNRNSSSAVSEPSILDLQESAQKQVYAWAKSEHPVVDCDLVREICMLLCIDLPTEENTQEEDGQCVVWTTRHAGPRLVAGEGDDDEVDNVSSEDHDDEVRGFGSEKKEDEDDDDDDDDDSGENDDDDNDYGNSDDAVDPKCEEENENEVFSGMKVYGTKNSRSSRESEQQWGASSLRLMMHQSKKEGKNLDKVTNSIGNLTGALTSFLEGANGGGAGGAGGAGGGGNGMGGSVQLNGRIDALETAIGGRIDALETALETAVGEMRGDLSDIRGMLTQIAGFVQPQQLHQQQQQQPVPATATHRRG